MNLQIPQTTTKVTEAMTQHKENYLKVPSDVLILIRLAA